MESNLMEYMAQTVEKMPRPVAGIAAWLAAHIYMAIYGSGRSWWVGLFVSITLSAVLPTIAIVTSFQENLEWILRIAVLFIGLISTGFTIIISWPKVKGSVRKIIARKRVTRRRK